MVGNSLATEVQAGACGLPVLPGYLWAPGLLALTRWVCADVIQGAWAERQRKFSTCLALLSVQWPGAWGWALGWATALRVSAGELLGGWGHLTQDLPLLHHLSFSDPERSLLS